MPDDVYGVDECPVCGYRKPTWTVTVEHNCTTILKEKLHAQTKAAITFKKHWEGEVASNVALGLELALLQDAHAALRAELDQRPRPTVIVAQQPPYHGIDEPLEDEFWNATSVPATGHGRSIVKVNIE